MHIQKAVKKIFKLKGRPKFNPLIIHYRNIRDAEKDIFINKIFKNYIKSFVLGQLHLF